MTEFLTLEDIDHVAVQVKLKTKHNPKIGLILGSGLGGLADAVVDADTGVAVSDVTSADLVVSTAVASFVIVAVTVALANGLPLSSGRPYSQKAQNPTTPMIKAITSPRTRSILRPNRRGESTISLG